MKKYILSILALTVMATGFAASAAPSDDPKLEASKTGKDVFCRAKVKIENGLDQTMQIDRVRVSSSTEPGFYSEYEVSGSRYRPVSGATVPTPMLDVMVPAGHKLAVEVTYRKQITAGKDARFSAPKTDKAGAGAIQPGCTLGGQDLGIRVNE